MAEVVHSSEPRWRRLMQIPRWNALDMLEGNATCVADTLFRLGPNEYLVCVPHGKDLRRVQGRRFVTTIMWAQSEGAARRAQLMEIEADEPAEVSPPSTLLLGERVSTYGALLRRLQETRTPHQETASYRIGKDGAFIHRNIVATPYTYHFRSQEHDDTEPCYAIKYVLSEAGGLDPLS